MLKPLGTTPNPYILSAAGRRTVGHCQRVRLYSWKRAKVYCHQCSASIRHLRLLRSKNKYHWVKTVLVEGLRLSDICTMHHVGTMAGPSTMAEPCPMCLPRTGLPDRNLWDIELLLSPFIIGPILSTLLMQAIAVEIGS